MHFIIKQIYLLLVRAHIEQSQQSLMSLLHFESPKKNFLLFMVMRILIGMFIIRTVHKSDEAFQGPEVAHHMVFGYGELSWEWTFKDPIRNPLFPIVYAIGYFLLKLFGLEGRAILIQISTKLTQALIGAGFDTVLLELNKLYNGGETSKILVFFNFTSWVSITYFSRTYVNSLQALITTLAFYYWVLNNISGKNSNYYKIIVNGDIQHSQQQNYQKSKQHKYDLISRALVVLGFLLRGTSIMYWIVVWPYQLFKYRSSSLKQAIKFIIKNIITLMVMISLSILLSVLWYRRLLWVESVTQYNFIKGWSQLCGTSPFYQYFIIYQYKIFSFGLLFLLYSLYSIFSDIDTRQAKNKQRWKQIILISILQMIFLSFSSHKQLRFMLVLFPAQLMLLVRGFSIFPFKKLKRVFLLIYLAISLYYVVSRNIIIKHGSLPIVNYIRDHQQITEVLYHLQSYDLPMYSSIHRNITIIMPEASFVTSIQKNSEMEFAKSNPQGYLDQVVKRLGHYPQYMVMISTYLEMEQDKGGLRLGTEWKKVMDEWYPSPIEQHYQRRIYLYQYTEV